LTSFHLHFHSLPSILHIPWSSVIVPDALTDCWPFDDPVCFISWNLRDHCSIIKYCIVLYRILFYCIVLYWVPLIWYEMSSMR
jgi:hypothetical protein